MAAKANGKTPIAEPMVEMVDNKEVVVKPWEETRDLINSDQTHWLATVRSDGRPHLVPLGPTYMDGALYITTGQGTQKEKNILENPHCVISTSNGGYDLIFECEAARVTDDATLKPLAKLYNEAGWPATDKDGAFDAPYSAPTTGPAPYNVYRLTIKTAFALGTTLETVNRCTRYRF